MKSLLVGPALLSLAILGGCAEAEHPVCVDDASTQEYSLKWQEDLRLAKEAGKLTIDDVVKYQGEIYSKFSLLKAENWGAWCMVLDKVRQTGKF